MTQAPRPIDGTVAIRTTTQRWLPLIGRLVAGVPLTVFGTMKFLSEATQTNFHATLVLAGFPMPDMLVYVAATVEVVAGAILLTGWFARIGAGLASLHMTVALYVHLTVDFSLAPAGGPPNWLPISVLVAALVVLRFGGGMASLDLSASRRSTQ